MSIPLIDTANLKQEYFKTKSYLIDFLCDWFQMSEENFDVYLSELRSDPFNPDIEFYCYPKGELCSDPCSLKSYCEVFGSYSDTTLNKETFSEENKKKFHALVKKYKKEIKESANTLDKLRQERSACAAKLKKLDEKIRTINDELIIG